MFYTYESGGRVSRPVFDYRTEVLSGSFAARGLKSFKFNQGPAVPLSDIGGTLAQYASRSIYNTESYRSGLGILNGAQTSAQDVPDGYVPHQGGPTYEWTTNELGGNLDPQSNRVLVPAPSRFLVFNNAEESKSYSYHPAILDLYTEVDFGSITQNATTTSNNGLVADLNATQVEYGRIIHVTDLESFGFSKTLNAASWKATSAWVGEGSLISFGRQTSPAVYGIIIDGKVKGLSGTADVDYSPASYGRGILPLQGTSVIGIGAALIGSGSLKKFTGTSESFTINPDEKQMLFSFFGDAIQKNSESYFGNGSLKNFSNAIDKQVFAWNGSGTISIVSRKPFLYTLDEIADWILGDISNKPLSSIKYELSDEKHTESYNESAIVPWSARDYGSLAVCTTEETISGDVSGNATGCIIKVDTTARVVSGQTYQVAASLNAPTNTVDWGDITTIASLQQDWGYIYDSSNLMPQGGIKVDPTVGAADKFLPSWTSRGYIGKITGVASVPLDVGVRGTGGFRFLGASKTNFSLLQPADGLFTILSSSKANFGVGILGDGTFSTFSGSADSVSFNPEEKQLLFSFTSGYSSLKFTHGTFDGDGVLYNFAGGDERAAFDWVGTGGIELKSAKPDTLTLRDLADYGLGTAHPYDLYFDPDYDQLGTVLLKNLGDEISEEIFAKAYNLTSEIPFQDLDYGLIIDPSTYTCVDTNGDVLASTTAPSGCIKVSTELAISTGATYAVPPQTTQPTFSEDYGLISNSADEPRDYDWILGTIAMGMRYTLVDIVGSAASKFQPNWVGRGGVTVLGASDTPRARDYIASGTLFAIDGSANVFSKAEVGEGLFKIDGDPAIAFSPRVIGTGTFKKFSGAAESLTFNPDEKQMLFSFTGTAGDPVISYGVLGTGSIKGLSGSIFTETDSYVGSGTITLRSVKPELTEPSEEKHTEVYDINVCYDLPEIDNGFIIDASLATCTLVSGSISQNTTATTGCSTVDLGQTLSIDDGVTYTVPIQVTSPSLTEQYGFIVDPEDELRDYGWILGTLSKVCPFGSISTLRGTSGPAVRTFREIFTGETEVRPYSMVLGGEADIVVPPQWDSPAEPPVKVYGAGKPNFSLRTFGSGRLYGMGGAAETVGYSPDTSQLLFKFVPGPFDRWTTYDWQPSWVSRGGVTIPTGEAKTHYVPNVVGTGFLPVLAGAAESITFNPEERQMLFSFIGTRISEKHTETFTGSGDIKVYPEAADFRFIPKYPGSGHILTSGIAKTHYVPNVIGTGLFKKFSGAAESITFNPEEKQMLFSFVGTREAEKVSVTETGFGTLHLTGESTQLLTFAEQPFGTIPVSGEAKTHYVPSVVGSGTLRKISGAAESITFNPEEKQMLFSFTGAGSQTTTVVPPEGFGTLFGFSGASITTRSAYETQGLYQISGDGHITASLLHVGSGTFRKFAGAAESLTVNPDERQLLFSFTGAGSESTSVAEIKQVEVDITGKADPVLRTFAWHGSGTISVTGEAKTHYVPHVIGTGYIPVFNGAAESLTVNPEEKQMLFSFTGTKEERILVREVSQGGTLKLLGTSGDPLLTFAEQPYVQTKISGKVSFTVHRSIFGSGSLYAFSGAAEATAIAPEPSTILFQTYGESELRITRSYVGSGTLRKISGAAESVTFNPDEQQMLFSFTGAGTQSKTAREIGTGTLTTTGEAGVLIRFAHTGEGTISLSGDAHTTRARDFVGFGTIPVLTGAAESISFNPEEKQLLFSFHGKRISEKITARELSQGGTLVVGSTSGDPLLTFAEQPYVRLDITGDSYDIRTRAYQGSGRISNVNNLDEAFARTPYIGSGIATITGDAFVQVQLFQPPHVQVWII